MLDEDKSHKFRMYDLFEEEAFIDEIFDESDEENDNDKKLDREAVQAEINQLQYFIDLALEVQNDAKSKALLEALENAFSQAICRERN